MKHPPVVFHIRRIDRPNTTVSNSEGLANNDFVVHKRIFEDKFKYCYRDNVADNLS